MNICSTNILEGRNIEIPSLRQKSPLNFCLCEESCRATWVTLYITTLLHLYECFLVELEAC